MSVFRFSDYDSIGFDLDFTLVRYNITNLVQLEYDVIVNYLVDKKGYNPTFLKGPLTGENLDFLQKGLFFDFERGNILKLNPDGKVYRASHGTKFLNDDEIQRYYPNREWELSKLFSEDPLVTWNGPLSTKIRSILDCFDVPGGLVFARAVDSLDNENGEPLKKYNVWSDILDAFNDMYSREQMQNKDGSFYAVVQNNPSKYIHKCHPSILNWIRSIKKQKKTFLITGSNLDYVDVIATHSLGEHWKSLFDVIVCYAKKPAFFTSERPFYSLKNYYEDKIVTSEELEIGGIYNQGNWKDLTKFFSRISGVPNPRCLYVGDNLLQDVYAVNKYTTWDAVVISEEQLAEKMLHHDLTHRDEDILNSKVWGSFFSLEYPDGYKDSFWNYIIKKNSKICIPQLDMVTSKPLNDPIKCFVQQDDDKELSGYHPAKPITLSNMK